MRALYSELCWFAPQAHKGRPGKGCRRQGLAEAIKYLPRDDVPTVILEAIRARLKKPPEKDRLRKPWRALMKRRRASRDSFIWSINREIVNALTKGIEPCHPAIVVSVDARAGILEATATTMFFRFKDDVAVRVRPDPTRPGGSIVDMRSISRVGGSDVGVNAARIRRFLFDLANA